MGDVVIQDLTWSPRNLPGEMQTTVYMRQVSCGTEVNIVQEGIPEATTQEDCYLGWQESLGANAGGALRLRQRKV